MDTTLLNNVNNILSKVNASLKNIEVIHTITWKNLKIDPLQSEVIIFYF